MILLNIVLATLAGGLLSVIAAMLLIAGFPQRWLPRLVGFATGVLLAVALLDVLPEAFESGVDPHRLFVTLLIGLLGFYTLERAALWRHAHVDNEGHDHHCPSHAHQHTHGSGLGSHTAISVLVGDGFHNFVDGLLIAATFLSDPALGWSTAFAVIAHEIPQEAGDFAILRAGGMSSQRALLFNGFSSLMAVAGGILGYFMLGSATLILPYILIIAAASFLYIAISDLLPLLRQEAHRATSIWQTAALLGGIAAIALSNLGHGH